jgi:hypothetical protein
MDINTVIGPFVRIGQPIMVSISGLSILLGGIGLVNVAGRRPIAISPARVIFWLIGLLVVAGFGLICWFHYRIYRNLPLELPAPMVPWLNQQLSAMNSQAAYAFPLFDPTHPPRYLIPLWIENEKYYFLFMCFCLMAYLAFRRTSNHRLQGVLLLFLAIQSGILFLIANPFSQPLPKFFQEISPWFSGSGTSLQRFSEFMHLYPRMIFYYNAPYMWLHPPMLFLSYSAITITFITSVFMLVRRDPEVEALGYEYGKFGYFMLTLGMLLGYPWALQAWGPNWWWDPKICSSIMMWAIYSTYLHTRLYTNKKSMWYFTSVLGIVCFVAMVFTFITSFYFPGEHTFQ